MLANVPLLTFWLRLRCSAEPGDQPSGSGSFQALSPGEPLLFKLRSPNNFIVGGGFFSHYSILPASFAWSAFGLKNGAAECR
jgi:putative restriction endonuclease